LIIISKLTCESNLIVSIIMPKLASENN
jgi:hypothetical protein